MRTSLYTVHYRPGRELEVIPDHTDLLAYFVPPAWAIWQRCWIALAVMSAILLAVGAISEPGAVVAFYGIVVITGLEGGAIRRTELRLRGWREVGCVQAATEEGAEELYLSGRAA